MQIEVLNNQGQKTGRTVDLPEDIFGVSLMITLFT